MKEARITAHAQERGRQRLGLHRSALQRTADRVLAEGITHAEATGQLKRYIDRLYLSHKPANAIRIYGEQVYIFHGVTLITVLPLPHNLRGLAAKIRGRGGHSPVRHGSYHSFTGSPPRPSSDGFSNPDPNRSDAVSTRVGGIDVSNSPAMFVGKQTPTAAFIRRRATQTKAVNTPDAHSDSASLREGKDAVVRREILRSQEDMAP